ncbi:hypothetical protein MZD04_gp003 [Pseudomonas phage Psa21]|uniref:Uncharacterized protein n=1 Tax=Pseudomonas phage Psa21 TaxID=2530023 RepID=A0A481W576_9CAUD|nr:hypothetical protein MZD04_gp003 [Pseudomonas phage Psa21]QBJ02533.1 hypothetical protein PSA21_3 [Pseudomonas phage Psa21]
MGDHDADDECVVDEVLSVVKAKLEENNEPVYDGGFAPDLHTFPPYQALDIITARVADLVEATVNPDGTLPRTVTMVIDNKIVEVDRVIASQFMRVLFIDQKVDDRQARCSRLLQLLKNRFGNLIPHTFNGKVTRVEMEVDAVTLDIKSTWDVTHQDSNNSAGISLPTVKRYVYEDKFFRISEMHRFIWELGQVSGHEIRHDGVLPNFIVTILPESSSVIACKLQSERKVISE